MKPEDHPAQDATAARRAAEELRAAELLLLEEELAPTVAQVHLDRAREALGASRPEGTEAPQEDDQARRAALAELRQLWAAHAACGLDPATARRARRIRLLLAAALLAIPAALYVGMKWTSFFTTPWRASYYANRKLEGEAIVRWEEALEHDWGNTAPVDGIPPDDFSARWETCLVLEDDMGVAFQLGSDDGARLLIDGEQVVDNWGKHRFRARSAALRLEEGVHHIEVQYFEARKLARVALLAAIEDAAPGQLPRALLRAPAGPGDAGEPCGGIQR